MVVATNQCLHRSYTRHLTLLVDVGVVIQHYACIQRCNEPRSGTHIEVLSHPRLSGSKRSSSSPASAPVCNTSVLDVAWRSDRREIFSTHQNNGFRCSLESKGLQIRVQRPDVAQEASTCLQQVVCQCTTLVIITWYAVPLSQCIFPYAPTPIYFVWGFSRSKF